MSWNDPCTKCGEARYACECQYKRTSMTKQEEEEIKNKTEEQKTICSEIGHSWQYTFIVYICARCGETSEY